MSQATLPWIQRTPEFWGRLRGQAMLLLMGGGVAALLSAALGLLLVQNLSSGALTGLLYAVTVGLPILAGLAGQTVWLFRQNPIMVLLAGAPIGAGVLNGAILALTPMDHRVFGVLLLVIAPALGGLTLLVAAMSVQFYRELGRILPHLALSLFLGGLIGLTVAAWGHSEIFRYLNQLSADARINTPATSFLGGQLTVAELQAAIPGRLSFLAYPLWPLQFAVVKDLIGLGAVLGFINIIPLFGIWWERKVAGRIQSRLGPMRVGGWHGWAQSFADGIKLVFKEDFVPPQGDPALFRLAAYLAFVPAVCAFVALPFASLWAFRELDVALVFILAMLGIEVIGVIIAGWASNNKWSVYGAMREACQMVSYEIPMGMALLIPVMTAGTLNLVHIVDGYAAAGDVAGFAGQSGGFWTWLVFRNPFCFAAAVVYYVASLASCKRAPFDLPESESELVAGFHTEYSGFRWSLFFFAEYAAMWAVCGLSVALFFGGWYSPLPNSWAMSDATIWGRAVNGLLFNGPLWFIAKAWILLYVQIWIRWTLPRIRIDQVLYACIQVLLPFTMLVLLGNTFWMLLERMAWFGVVSVLSNVALSAGGAAAFLICLYWIVHGYSNNKRLVGTLAIDHLPGA